MKRILLIFMLAMLMGIGVASAEIKEGTDKFTNGKWITSGTFIENQEWVGFRKSIDGPRVKYVVMFSEKELKNVKYSPNRGEMKIDSDPARSVTIQEVSSQPILYSDMSHISLTALIDHEQAEKMKNANRVAFKFYKTDGTASLLVLPDSVLAEWKQVIDAEKN